MSFLDLLVLESLNMVREIAVLNVHASPGRMKLFPYRASSVNDRVYYIFCIITSSTGNASTSTEFT